MPGKNEAAPEDAKPRHGVILRPEMADAMLDLGGKPVDLSDYATTGLRVLAIGPSGVGKTNVGLLIGEQLAEQGWISVFVDPEGEVASMYGEPVPDPETLRVLLMDRKQPFIVVSAKDPAEFVPYGEVIQEVVDRMRKPVYLMVDEGQIFSSNKTRGEAGEASNIINDLLGRGRKRAVDIFMTALRFTGTMNRSVFALQNLLLVGSQHDPRVWPDMAPQFRKSGVTYDDLSGLKPSEFFCFHSRGMEKVRMPMAKALALVAPPAPIIESILPRSFSQWDRAMAKIPMDRLEALTDPVIDLMAAITGLTAQQIQVGRAALGDELEMRG